MITKNHLAEIDILRKGPRLQRSVLVEPAAHQWEEQGYNLCFLGKTCKPETVKSQKLFLP